MKKTANTCALSFRYAGVAGKLAGFFIPLMLAMPVRSYGQADSIKLSAPETSNNREEKAIQTLKDFYTAYISDCDSPAGNSETRSTIKNKYLTKRLSDKLENTYPDYDPLIQAQDCDRETLKTLEVKPETEQENVYCVYYTWLDGKKIQIKLRLVEENGCLLIDAVLTEDIAAGQQP
jgi:hypothetical protein